LSLRLTSYALRHEGVCGSGCIDPHFLTSVLVGGDWSASRSGGYTQGEKTTGTPLDRRLDGHQSWSGRRGEEKILDPTGTRTPTPLPSSPWEVAIPTEPSRLQYFPRIH
jgi:hypothetical protein